MSNGNDLRGIILDLIDIIEYIGNEINRTTDSDLEWEIGQLEMIRRKLFNL